MAAQQQTHTKVRFGGPSAGYTRENGNGIWKCERQEIGIARVQFVGLLWTLHFIRTQRHAIPAFVNRLIVFLLPLNSEMSVQTVHIYSCSLRRSIDADWVQSFFMAYTACFCFFIASFPSFHILLIPYNLRIIIRLVHTALGGVFWWRDIKSMLYFHAS